MTVMYLDPLVYSEGCGTVDSRTRLADCAIPRWLCDYVDLKHRKYGGNNIVEIPALETKQKHRHKRKGYNENEEDQQEHCEHAFGRVHHSNHEVESSIEGHVLEEFAHSKKRK